MLLEHAGEGNSVGFPKGHFLCQVRSGQILIDSVDRKARQGGRESETERRRGNAGEVYVALRPDNLEEL